MYPVSVFPTVSVKLVKSKEITLVRHVDDLKVLHKDLFKVTMFAQYLLTIYRNKVNVHKGKKHDYLGIFLDYSEIGVVKVSMIKYLQKVLDKFPEDLRGMTATLAADYLFQVRGEEDA